MVYDTKKYPDLFFTKINDNGLKNARVKFNSDKTEGMTINSSYFAKINTGYLWFLILTAIGFLEKLNIIEYPLVLLLLIMKI